MLFCFSRRLKICSDCTGYASRGVREAVNPRRRKELEPGAGKSLEDKTMTNGYGARSIIFLKKHLMGCNLRGLPPWRAGGGGGGFRSVCDGAKEAGGGGMA